MNTSRRGKNSATRKGRRNPGACDICRRRKIKCDSGERMGGACTHCIMARLECTHHESIKSLGHAKGYITSLETRLEKMEKVLNKLYPGIDLSTELDLLADKPEAYESRASSISLGLVRNEEEDENENMDSVITRKLQKMDIENRFYGGSSSFRLIRTALNLKGRYIGETLHNVVNTFKPRKREEFWVSHPWQRGKLDEEPNPNASTPEYPDDDLLTSLVDLYFQEFNIILPLLHRPTFERQIAECLHTRNLMFGNVVLLVCALGAKYSNDPRVFTEGSNTTRSAGHKWYAQVDSYQKAYVVKPTLHELQMIVLLLLFEKSTGNHTSYVRAGLGLRLTQEVGAHRRKLKKGGHITTEDELWKRAFWILFVYDRFLSAAFGRPCTIHREDYDQDYPIECDDDYWELPDSSKSFQQPPDKPSIISYFNCFLRLVEIYSEAVRVLYSTRKSPPVFVADLDSAMNKWIDCVPEHLRWDPNRKNMLFLKQSAVLYTTYYGVQIFIHRPFIHALHNPSSTLTPSLAMCTNAARSSCYVVDVLNRLKIMPPSLVQSMCSTAAFILLVNLWDSKRSGNPRRELELVQKVLDMLNICEQRWTCAGRTRDLITELSSLSDADGSMSDIVNISKAEQNSDLSSQSPSSNGVYGSTSPMKSTVHQQEVPLRSNYALPLNDDELGQVYAYEHVFTGKPLNDQLSKSGPVGGDNEAFPLREMGSGSTLQEPANRTIGDQGMSVSAGAPGVQNDGQMAEIWQMMSIDDMTSWLLSTNVFEWESYFMDVDQQQELTIGRYA